MNTVEPCYIRYSVVSPGQYIGTSFDCYADARNFMIEAFNQTGAAGMDVLLFMRNGSDDVLLARKEISSIESAKGVAQWS